jgi:nucleotide-binding universal stress UspA family protein
MFQHLLVPIDGSELSARAITASIELAVKLGAAITGFVVEPDAQAAGAAMVPAQDLAAANHAAAAHAKTLLQHFGAQAKDAGVKFHSHFVRTDSIDQAIVQAAIDKQCDLVVMITHGRGAFGELLFGSHTKNVMARSKLPLLVLH